jgi:hypothetical protein
MSISNHPVEYPELMAYLDGELQAERAAETASHLERCPECQKLAAELREVSQMLMSWQVEESELKLTEQIDAAFEQREQEKLHGFNSKRKLQKSFLSTRLLWAGGLAAVAVLVIAISTPHLHLSRSVGEGAFQHSAQAPMQATRPGQAGKAPRKVGGIDAYGSTDGLITNGSVPKTIVEDGPLQMSDSSSSNHVLPRPVATPQPGLMGKLQRDENSDQEEASSVPVNNGPMIVRTAELALTTNKFDQARPAVEEILKRHQGYVGELNVSTPTGSARSLTGTLRVPASRLDAALADFKGLGRVEKETQGGEEVTQRYVDLQARLKNSRTTEKRLTDMLRDRTGKLSDVLSVELQISRVRGEIEQMEAERKGLKNQVDYATLSITVNEDYKAELKVVPPSTSTQIRNAAVEGYRSLVDGLLGLLLWLISVLPTLLVWCAVLFFPARIAWKKLRPRFISSKQ